jgi:hypothetical protein
MQGLFDQNGGAAQGLDHAPCLRRIPLKSG